MKKILLFSLTLLFVIGCNKDDDGSGSTEITNSYVGDIMLRTQQEVNDFGSLGYTSVEGEVCIGCVEQNDIDDLSPLRTLKKVKTLSILNNTVLIDLDGLENITELDNLLISKNPLLENLDSFNGITTINTIEFDDNGSLRNIDGLSNLTAIREGIKFSNTRVIDLNFENVSVLGDFESIDSRFESFTIGATKVGTFTLNNSYSLTQLNLSNFEEMDHFYLIENNQLTNLNIENLQKINGNLSLIENNQLTNLNIENLQKINGTFSFVRNVALSSLNLENLTSVGILEIKNTRLTNVNLVNLQTPSEPTTTIITGNGFLTNINLNNITKANRVVFTYNALEDIQLGGLTTVESDFTIKNNPNITSINLNNLTQIDGYININDNQSLEAIYVNSLTVAEDIEVKDNNQLTTLSLPNLSSLKSLRLHNSKIPALNLESLQNRPEPTSFFINENPFLTSTNFGAMTIAKDVRFEGNIGLTDLPLSNLTKIEASLYVVNCDNIVNLNIENITEVGEMRIVSNSQLETFIANNITQATTIIIHGSNWDLSTITMNNLGVITGDLHIYDFWVHSNFTNLDGFTGLHSIEGALKIINNDNLSDFCGITNLITNGSVGTYTVSQNWYNPTQQDIIDGNCSI